MADDDASQNVDTGGDDTGTGNQSGADDKKQHQDDTRRGDDDRGDRDQSRRRARTRSSSGGDDDGTSDAPANGEPKFTQADLDKQIEKRLERERKRYADYDDGKASASDTKAQMDKLREDMGKALGFTKDDAPPDPEQLKHALSDRDRDLKAKDDVIAAKDAEIADLKAERDGAIAVKEVELAAWREATKQGVNASMLLNLRSTERALAALDFGADDFADELAELIKTEAKDNPALMIKAASTAADAGLGGATGSGDTAASAAPGLGRLKAAYATTP